MNRHEPPSMSSESWERLRVLLVRASRECPGIQSFSVTISLVEWLKALAEIREQKEQGGWQSK